MAIGRAVCDDLMLGFQEKVKKKTRVGSEFFSSRGTHAMQTRPHARRLFMNRLWSDKHLCHVHLNRNLSVAGGLNFTAEKTIANTLIIRVHQVSTELDLFERPHFLVRNGPFGVHFRQLQSPEKVPRVLPTCRLNFRNLSLEG